MWLRSPCLNFNLDPKFGSNTCPKMPLADFLKEKKQNLFRQNNNDTTKKPATTTPARKRSLPLKVSQTTPNLSKGQRSKISFLRAWRSTSKWARRAITPCSRSPHRCQRRWSRCWAIRMRSGTSSSTSRRGTRSTSSSSGWTSRVRNLNFKLFNFIFRLLAKKPLNELSNCPNWPNFMTE